MNKILHSFTIDEISAVDKPAQKHAKVRIMKSDSSTEAARAASEAGLREKKIQDYVRRYGVTRAEAERAVGAMKSAGPSEADVIGGTMLWSAEEHAKQHGTSVAKGYVAHLATPAGRDDYEAHCIAKARQADSERNALNDAFEILAKTHLAECNGNSWQARLAVLKTVEGQALYRKMAEAA